MTTRPAAHVPRIVLGVTFLVATLSLMAVSGKGPAPAVAIAMDGQVGPTPAVSVSHPPLSSRPQASELVLVLDPEDTRVRFTVGATFHHGGIHGSSNLASGEIHFDPHAETATGEIVIDVASTSTHHEKRDKHMHKDVLESAKYPRLVFVPTGFEGDFYRDDTSDVNLLGHLDIHGVEHPMTLHVHVVTDGDHVQGTTEFDVPYVKWGMKSPSKFILKVSKTVHVHLQFSGTLVSPPQPTVVYPDR